MIRWTCRKCRLSIRMTSILYPVHCACGAVDQGPWPIGDVVASVLSRLGITRQNWTEWRICGGGMTACLVHVAEADRKCGCGKRRAALNRAGNAAAKWLGNIGRHAIHRKMRRVIASTRNRQW